MAWPHLSMAALLRTPRANTASVIIGVDGGHRSRGDPYTDLHRPPQKAIARRPRNRKQKTQPTFNHQLSSILARRFPRLRPFSYLPANALSDVFTTTDSPHRKPLLRLTNYSL